ncbi:MAG: M24 family metallopeptidase [Planctomycetota bacterium]|jgi:Xaa-Pro aminopeptidase
MSDVFARRCARLLRAARRLAHCRAVLVSKRENVRYLTGFTGEDSWLIISPRRRTLLTDSRFAEEAGKTCPEVQAHVRKGPLVEEAAGLIRSTGLRAAFEADELSFNAARRLKRKFRTRKPVPAAGLVEALRLVKDDTEIASIRGAIRTAEKALRLALGDTGRDTSEKTFAAALEYQMRLQGAEGAAFETIAAREPNSSLPHAKPTGGALFGAPTFLVDWGARAGGYNSDLTRVIATGKVGPRIRAVHKVVRAAQKAAIRAIKAGVSARKVDGAARRVIAQAGYGEFFGHGTGHGLGLAVHEGPVLSPRAGGRLRGGMIVTVEPGVYLPGEGGVRIEDVVLVTTRGGRVLTSLTRDPASLGALIPYGSARP